MRDSTKLAQGVSVEPVPDDIVAGALYDFLGYLTTRRTRIIMSDRDDAGAAVDALIDWSKTRKINLTEARVRDWNNYTNCNTVDKAADEIEKLEADLAKHRELLLHHLSVIDPLRAENAQLKAELAAITKDAERYRWLRNQHWNDSDMCVVESPKESLKLGSRCPSGELLDVAIDAATSVENLKSTYAPKQYNTKVTNENSYHYPSHTSTPYQPMLPSLHGTEFN